MKLAGSPFSKRFLIVGIKPFSSMTESWNRLYFPIISSSVAPKNLRQAGFALIAVPFSSEIHILRADVSMILSKNLVFSFSASSARLRSVMSCVTARSIFLSSIFNRHADMIPVMICPSLPLKSASRLSTSPCFSSPETNRFLSLGSFQILSITEDFPITSSWEYPSIFVKLVEVDFYSHYYNDDYSNVYKY